jgi:ribosomal protein L10
MPLNIEQKKDIVKELNIFANDSVSGAIAEYSGLRFMIFLFCAIKQEN